MPTYYPPNVVGGIGAFNLTNVKFTGLNSSDYIIGVASRYASTDARAVKLYVNYCDIPAVGNDAYSSFVSSWFTYPNTVFFNLSLNKVKVDATKYYICNPSLLLDNSSTNAATHGTSQYPIGFTPVPTASPSGRILRVGPSRTYTTVHAAYLAAVHGDDIIIDPGLYDCTQFYGAGTVITKCVRFWGATEDPDDVILYSGANHYYGDHFFFWLLEYFINIPNDFKAPGMFHLTLRADQPDPWEVTVDIGMNYAPPSDPTEWWPPVENPFWTEYDDTHEEEKFYE